MTVLKAGGASASKNGLLNFAGLSLWLLHRLLEQPHLMDREQLLPNIPSPLRPSWPTSRQVQKNLQKLLTADANTLWKAVGHTI